MAKKIRKPVLRVGSIIWIKDFSWDGQRNYQRWVVVSLDPHCNDIGLRPAEKSSDKKTYAKYTSYHDFETVEWSVRWHRYQLNQDKFSFSWNSTRDYDRKYAAVAIPEHLQPRLA